MLHDAKKFIATAMADKKLRLICYQGAEQGNLMGELALAGFTFTVPEFDDAVVHHLFICKDEDEADNLKQFQLWFKNL